jgi:hypothetical protein
MEKAQNARLKILDQHHPRLKCITKGLAVPRGRPYDRGSNTDSLLGGSEMRDEFEVGVHPAA